MHAARVWKKWRGGPGRHRIHTVLERGSRSHRSARRLPIVGEAADDFPRIPGRSRACSGRFLAEGGAGDHLEHVGRAESMRGVMPASSKVFAISFISGTQRYALGGMTWDAARVYPS